MTPRDLIKSAMRKIGVIASGETPTASELQDAFEILNLMIKSFSNERLMLFKVSRVVFPLIANQAKYSIGTGGDFNVIAPMNFVGAATGNYASGDVTQEIPVEVSDYQTWASQAFKSMNSDLPRGIYVEDTVPLKMIHVWPVPNGGKGLVLYVQDILTTFATVDDEIVLPEGYEEMLIHNLAVRFKPEFGGNLDPIVVEIAKETKASIKRQNTKIPRMTSDAEWLSTHGRSRYSIITGGYI